MPKGGYPDTLSGHKILSFIRHGRMPARPASNRRIMFLPRRYLRSASRPLATARLTATRLAVDRAVRSAPCPERRLHVSQRAGPARGADASDRRGNVCQLTSSSRLWNPIRLAFCSPTLTDLTMMLSWETCWTTTTRHPSWSNPSYRIRS